MSSYEDIVKAVKETSEVMSNFDIANYTDGDLNKLSDQVNTLADLNNSFPVVQSFLKVKGLTHINQLDNKGQGELLEFLEDILTTIKKKE